MSVRNNTMLLAAALLATSSWVALASPAEAHRVVCTNNAQQPYTDFSPEPGRAPYQGATIIECTPTAPDGQRTEVQLQFKNNGTGAWQDRGTSYLTYSNARFHREYDSTTCTRNGRSHYWRTKAIHAGTHGNTVIKTDFSSTSYLTCYK